MKVPAFQLENQHGEFITEQQLLGQTSILYFYPRDNTPTCTAQAVDFTEHIEYFAAKGIQVYGISGDSRKKHQNFITKHHIGFDLLVDDGFKLSEQLGIYQLKKSFGKEAMGIVRTTLIIGPDLEIMRRFDKVKVKEQFDDITAALEGQS
ncbi:peroxiredoxin [Macrococcus equipercicus]|uniref:thioredoxin-dependent peroxiredoxin n=1 Tax=Macrococcus equipercicus TaxID=69967 RepID=A0A9Q9BSG4_9STAP|nr:peroxiredoxin [Macrococcus equipercicus]KAA1037662.1 peroxiredoxin [Macrococcus equipercicus]UTH13374.1 peroxiredoxin [Macrococcus equipercicus]